MTRRPKSRLPPKLADAVAARVEPVTKAPSVRDRLKRDHVAGRSTRFGRDEIFGVMSQLVMGAPGPRFGLPPFPALDSARVQAAVTDVYGWKGDGPRARIAPSRTLDGFRSLTERVLEVAQAGGRLAFATARPASLLPVYRRLAHAAKHVGGDVLTAVDTTTTGPGALRVWWIDDVAVLTDQTSLLGRDDVEAAREVLFALPRPDLFVGDRTFAGVALASGLEVAALADLDALAFAVAAWQGRSVRVAPLDDHRPPGAYLALLEIVAELTSRREEAVDDLPNGLVLTTVNGEARGPVHGGTAPVVVRESQTTP